MRNKSLNIILVVLFCIFFITACGGGGGSNSSAPAPDIYLAQSSIDFAGIVKDNYIDRTFIIENKGSADLNIGQISKPASPFSISSDTGSNKTLAPSQTCSLMVRFSPTNQGSSTGTFSIPSNDPDSPTVNVALKGEGYGLNVWINKVNTADCPDIFMDVAVTGPDGPVTNLKDGNFIFKLNGGEQPCDFIGNFVSEPISVVLALDFSGSLYKDLDAIKEAAKSFINLLRDTDEAAICKFEAEIDFFPETGLTAINDPLVGKDALKSYIDEDFNAANGTALYDAVFDSIDRASEGTNDKLAVIVLSDGVNTVIEGKTLQEAIDHVKQIGIPVFSIFYVDLTYYPNATPDIMQQLAKDTGTGGQYYNSGNAAELESIFQQISNVLTNKYTIKFSSPCTGSIDLEVRAEVKDVSDDLYGFYGLDSRTIDLP